MIKRKGSCVGLQLFKWKRYLLEIWLCSESIGPHVHPNMDGEICLLWGLAKLNRLNLVTNKAVSTSKKFKFYSIQHTDAHWFNIIKGPILFINFEHWNCEPTSASEDFVTVTI